MVILGAAMVNAGAEETRGHEPVYRAWAEAGGVLLESTDVSFPGMSGDANVRFDPGVRLGAGARYNFRPWFALTWEVAVIGSGIDRASGLQEMDGWVTQVPLLMTAMLQYENASGFTPFVGIGAGGSSVAIHVDEARSGTSSIEGSDYDFVFAWQATGGVKYEWRNGLTLGLAYKYLWTSDAEWELEDDTALNTGDDELKMDGIRSHSFLAFISYRF